MSELNNIDWNYIRKLVSLVLIIVGTTLLLEHLLTWGGFDFWDFIGHEWYGLLLVLIGFVISLRFTKEDKNEIDK